MNFIKHLLFYITLKKHEPSVKRMAGVSGITFYAEPVITLKEDTYLGKMLIYLQVSEYYMHLLEIDGKTMMSQCDDEVMQSLREFVDLADVN